MKLVYYGLKAWLSVWRSKTKKIVVQGDLLRCFIIVGLRAEFLGPVMTFLMR